MKNLIKNIKQHFCHHYWVFDVDQPTNKSGVISQTRFKCYKCGMTVTYNSLLVGEAVDNMKLKYAELRKCYLDLLRQDNPSQYVNESKKW